MILATSITQSYFERSKPLFESAVKYFDGKRIAFCLGFTAEIEGWETVYVPLPLKCHWEPKNRPGYACLQHGEFVGYYPFKDDDMVLFVDSDMVLQREYDTNDGHLDRFFVTKCSFPPQKLKYASVNIGGNGKYLPDAEEFCACWILAPVKYWRILYKYIASSLWFLNRYEHHAAWQLLINRLIIGTLPFVVIGPETCCASWYAGSPAKYVDGVLKIGDETVYFNHTKFNNE